MKRSHPEHQQSLSYIVDNDIALRTLVNRDDTNVSIKRRRHEYHENQKQQNLYLLQNIPALTSNYTRDRFGRRGGVDVGNPTGAAMISALQQSFRVGCSTNTSSVRNTSIPMLDIEEEEISDHGRAFDSRFKIRSISNLGNQREHTASRASLKNDEARPSTEVF